MDLRAILSPPEEVASSSISTRSTPVQIKSEDQASRRLVQRALSNTSASGRSPRVSSPRSHANLPSSLPAHILGASQSALASPLISPVPVSSPRAKGVNRTSSSDTMTETIHIQTQQLPRPVLQRASSAESVEPIDSAHTRTLASFTSNNGPRASFDINMIETGKQFVRTDFTNTSLSGQYQQRLSQLAAYLADNPSAYDSHVEMINILHQGFFDHIYPSSDPDSRGNPSLYDLIDDLRIARERMDKLFAVGEVLWADWLQDESLLAKTTEERIGVVEKCRQAVEEEPSSVKLWLIYAEWVSHCYDWANQNLDADEHDQEELVGREIFVWDMVHDTWSDAAMHTKDDLAQSHLIWNNLIELRLRQLRRAASKDTSSCWKLFKTRLQEPHMEWESTFQLFSGFVTAHLPAEDYEQEMQTMIKAAGKAKRQVADREYYESLLARAKSLPTRDEEYTVFEQYIMWERTVHKRKGVDFSRCDALFERAELRFPSVAALWEEHVAFLIEQSRDPLPLLSRATRHCPWSGALWSQFLLSSETNGQLYHETEAIKHKATETGILESAGIAEILKVHSAWCSYLRRRACRPSYIRDEDDIDIAEMGIRASIESMSSLGAKLGMGDAPDPTFRLQRIYINFLSSMGRWDNARLEFDQAIHHYGRFYNFWSRFYVWEMMRWRKFALKNADEDSVTGTSAPHLATAILSKALEQEDLDFPELLVEAYISHCEDYEDTAELQAALLKVREVEKRLAIRRQTEALQQAELASQQVNDSRAHDLNIEDVSGTKRKREEDLDSDEIHTDTKKGKTEAIAVQSVEQTDSQDPKRDREHASILVSNLPENIHESKVRQYFSKYGTVKALKMIDDGTAAVVEFDEDIAAQYAISRDGQDYEGHTLSVVLDTGSTVFLTNYIPEADEAYLRNILERAGDLISVRFPSLQGNKRRRFCYAQFRLPEDAQEAVETLDDQEFDGLKLVCKISNPAVKKVRQETSVNDGRTVFVGGLNFKASESEVKEAFSDFGRIQLVRMPLHETMKNRNKGIAFVTFGAPEEAQAALAMSGREIKGRQVKVETATDNQSRAVRTSSATHDRVGSVTPMDTDSRQDRASVLSSTDQPKAQRTIYLIGVPDTVNEARLCRVGEKHGQVLKCVLKTTHQGAVLEYATISEAGEAALGLDGHEIEPGRLLKVVSESEMKVQRSEKKVNGFAPKPKVVSSLVSGNGIIRRPTQPGNRTRKGGHLGQRSVMLHASGISHEPDKEPTPQLADEEPAKKSNDDFRAMMTAKKEADAK